MRVSVDKAVAKAEKQLRRLVEKVHNHRPHNGGTRRGAESE
jgi:ribosome-associated translation inhibitor RaiA